MKTTVKQLGLTLIMLVLASNWLNAQTMVQVNASNPNIQYTGRINNTDPNNVIFSFPGVSIKAKFQGTAIDAIFTEYGSGGAQTTNYFNVIIDGGAPTVLKLSSAQTVYQLARNLADTEHTIELFKRTESSVGKVAFKGFQLVSGKTLVTPNALPSKKIEFIGNSITCGYGNESSANPPVAGFTSVNENNYKAWGAVTARNLNAQYSCVAYSGRGLYRNNSGTMTGTLPLIYDQSIADDASASWDHTRFTPDVIVINLGTNDFAAEVSSAAWAVSETTFGTTYKNFIAKLRGYYPNASIICAVGVMMSDYYPSGGQHWTRIQSYVSNVVSQVKAAGDNKVYYFKMDPQSPPYGEDWHPTAATDASMATALTSFINTNITFSTCTATVELGSDISINGKTFPITLNSNSTANTGVTYKWYKDNVLISNATSSTYQITSASGAVGTYKVIRDSASCSAQDQVLVTNTLLPVGKIASWDWNKKAAVALTFDDWTAGHPGNVVPELKSRNLTGTFFIATNMVYNASQWTAMNNAVTNGNEMANHSKSHVDLTTADLSVEILGAKNTINTNVTGQQISTFAYPFGTYNNTVINYLKSSGHIAARGVYPSSGNYAYNFATTVDDYYKILTTSIDASTTITSFTTPLTGIINGGGLLTYLYHSVSSTAVPDAGYASIPLSTFQSHLNALQQQSSNIWITTFSNAVKYHREAKCASLVEIQAPNGSEWILNLTDTLANNTMFNQPLYCMVKANGVKYDQITQNGKAITIDYNANDTLKFHAIPDGGSISLKVSSGIAVALTATPSSISNAATAIKFTATASATSPNTISQVTINLTSLGGAAAVAMTSLGSGKYEYTYTTTAGLTLGNKSVTATATDNNANAQTATTIIEIGSGISISAATVNPGTVINNVSNQLTFQVSATDDGTIASVKLDLSAIGGGNAVSMTKSTGNTYTLAYTLGVTALTGTKTITATVTDNNANTKTATMSLTIHPSVTYTDIYTDASSMICANCFWVGGGSFVEQTGTGAIEGSKHYAYNYSITGYWGAVGINIANWDVAQASNFSEYDSLEISYKGPQEAGVTMSVALTAAGNTNSSVVALTPSASYKTVRISVNSFTGVDLTKIIGLQFDMSGVASATGTVYLDNIRLVKAGSSVITGIQESVTKDNYLGVYPNPADEYIVVEGVNENKNILSLITVMAIDGRVVLTEAIKETNMNEQTIDISSLPAGLYLINTGTQTQKFIKK